jgi:hypothetical protein
MDNLCDDKSQDSFNEDIIKLYEDHKKNTNTKNDNRPNHRPISSYLRNLQNEKKENSIEEKVNPNECINRLNQFITRNNINITQFCENSDIFLDFEAFKDLFKNIRFDISNSEATFLFSLENKFLKDGFILMKIFFKTHENSLNWYKSRTLEIINNEYKIKKLNDEFKSLHQDILGIISKEEGIPSLKRSIKSPLSNRPTTAGFSKTFSEIKYNSQAVFPSIEVKKKGRIPTALERRKKEEKVLSDGMEIVYSSNIVEKTRSIGEDTV